jgi:hypothetical protein
MAKDSSQRRSSTPHSRPSSHNNGSRDDGHYTSLPEVVVVKDLGKEVVRPNEKEVTEDFAYGLPTTDAHLSSKSEHFPQSLSSRERHLRILKRVVALVVVLIVLGLALGLGLGFGLKPDRCAVIEQEQHFDR